MKLTRQAFLSASSIHFLFKSSGCIFGKPHFNLSKLPAHLRSEFDSENNMHFLQYLAGCRKDKAEVIVEPLWAHKVSWKCSTCGCTWSARPADRLNPQRSDAASCPSCRLQKSTKHTLPQGKKACCGSLVDTYPLLASQWDLIRNNLPVNEVYTPLHAISFNSNSLVWWICPSCKESWHESVVSRVTKYEKDGAAVCSSCTSRGLSTGGTAISTKERGAVLSDDRHLMDEVLLRPHEDPSEISLASEMVLNWKCKRCEYEYQMSLANRTVRYEQCPQCCGAVVTPLNSLCIQRPDVVKEVAKTYHAQKYYL
ncbi:hypothetical protein STCU_05567 [Strigomonas culicis]|uniref:Treble clef zinc finger domain-containing protein n=1 Tax=Strigomonas culicis TaxID=28005 RepID=S9VKZ5_9TRYP|nr:hypothetical protein STCU_05567 [Strigomonas culicis]|eukprot:EPY27771.1 hypothetical protein STCU_05567 [Strigomonas culicis]